MRRISQPMNIIILTVAFISYATCNGFYTIVAPKYIRPHLDYQVSITLHDDNEPAKIRLSIEDGANYTTAKTRTITSNQSELITLRIDDLDVTKGYKFVAEGLSGQRFKNESALSIESKNVSIFIQSDKGIYKPGETIKFRVLVLDWELRPVKLPSNTPLSIYLTDPEQNRVKQWLKATPKVGVFTSEFQLSELAILGNWKFEAKVDKESKIKIVEVAEYVLPKFDVKIDSANDFSIKDGKLHAIIRSMYTYGKSVKGEAIVSLMPLQTYYYDNTPKINTLKTIQIDGKGTVEFDFENDLKLDFSNHKFARNFKLSATVIEALTGRNQTESKTITVHQLRYKIEPLSLEHQFNPGLPMIFQISVKHQDKSLVLLNDETRWIIVGKIMDRYTINEKVTYYKFELNENGVANVRIPTLTNETKFHLEVKYMDEQSDLGHFYQMSVSEPAEFEAKILTKRPTLNQNVFIEVQSKELLQNFTYQLIAHGKVIYAKNVDVPDRHYHVIKFKATFAMVPKVTVIVYRFKSNDIVATSIDVDIDDDLNNFIKLKLSATEAQPGKDISINIITNAQSYVGLAGVDQSVLMLKKNEDLTQKLATQEMNMYQQHFHIRRSGPWDVHEQYYTNNYFRPFEYNNVILFTNAKKDTRRHVGIYDRSGIFMEDSLPMRFGMAAPMAGGGFANSLHRKSAMHMVDGSIGGSGPVEAPRVRTEFPETWLWEDFDVNALNGTLQITKKVPDTITSWVITGLSVNPTVGLGLTKVPKTLKVFQPFFVSLNLPYSVKRGEVVAVPAILFNYLDMDVSADVTLHNEKGHFEFIDDIKDASKLRKRQLTVASSAGVSSTFLVRFTSVGSIHLKVTATSAVAGDAVERVLIVEPEGVPQFINNAVFVDLRETNELDIVQKVKVPANAVDGSLKINVNAIGDLLGGTIQNLHQLIRLPTGCGEQNMLNFVPNIIVLDYLKAAGPIDGEIKERATKYLLSGYQRELTYRHSNGSFSAFGKIDGKGSTWLTAFVVKSFKQAEKYIDIDGKIIDEALEFLSSAQANDGSFAEKGHVIHEAMQGGSSNGVALTAYVTIAFLRNKKEKNWKHQETVNKAISNIESNIENIDNAYAKAIVAYALQLANHSKKDELLDDLVAQSIVKEQYKWFTKTKPGPNARPSISIDVEITSYGVLALIHAKRFAEVLPYFRWLLAQRNDRGGFIGTQDTVVGLEALALYGQYLTVEDNAIQLNIQADSLEDDRILNVNTENALVLQTIELPSATKSVHLTATGHGFALFQLSYRYNLNESDVYRTFALTPKVLETTVGHLSVEVCSRFNPKTADEKHSNMVVMEVSMPSGFLIDSDRLKDLLHKPHVKLAQTKNGETVVDVYIERMLPNQETCLDFHGYRSHKVAENKPVPVQIYDYYDSSRKARQFYEIPSITSCAICEGEECPKSCKK